MEDRTQGRVLEVLTDEDPLLRRISRPIGDPTDETRTLAADMLATMYAQSGIGLAAIQVGVPLRMIVLDPGTAENRRPMVMVDPVIEWAKKRCIDMEEGCLSVPRRRIDISRPTDIDVSFTDLDGVRQKRSLGGLPARIVQHEIDHLEGVLITDRGAPGQRS